MSVTHTETLSRNDVDDLSRRGLVFYDATLKPLLEPDQNRRYVAIHPETEEYAVADTSANAMRVMLERHPDGHLVIRKIGDEPDYGLSARILASELSAARRK